MYDWYRVLDVRSGASDDEIKAAFRRLIKQLHPDVRPDQANTDPRLRLVIRAYQILSDPQLRAAYDAALTDRYAQRRRWAHTRAATIAATFILTLGCVLAALQWGGPDQTLRTRDDRAGGAGAEIRTAAADPAAASISPPDPVRSPPVASETAAQNDSTTIRPSEPSDPTAALDQPPSDGNGARKSQALYPVDPAEDWSRAVSSRPNGRMRTATANRASERVDSRQRTAPMRWMPSAWSHRWVSYRNPSFGFALAYLWRDDQDENRVNHGENRGGRAER